MSGNISWQLSGNQASLVCGELRASLDARAPRHGLHDVSLGDRTLGNSWFLGVDVDAGGPDVLTDFYQRGADLIERYVETADRLFAAVVYWRAGLAPSGAVQYPYVDLLVSVETSLLDSLPRLQAQTRAALRIDELSSNSSPFYRIGRFKDAAASYLELYHPDDALTTSSGPTPDAMRWSTQLFRQPLEKGVLLRSRLRGLFLPGTDAESFAPAALDEFAA